MKQPSIVEMERVLRRAYPEAAAFPLVRTLSAAAWELGVSQRYLLHTLPQPQRVLWYWKNKVYVPPEVFERWRKKYEGRS